MHQKCVFHLIMLASLLRRIGQERCNTKPGDGFLNPALGFYGLNVGTSLCAKSPSHPITGHSAILPDVKVDSCLPIVHAVDSSFTD